jgi:hypothetical protein
MSNFTSQATTKAAAESFVTPITVLLLVLAVVIVLLNISIIFIFFKKKAVRENRHHNLVLTLSASNLILGVSVMTNCLRLLIPSWSEVLLPCILFGGLTLVGIFMSLCHAFLVSWHRFLTAVQSPWNDRLFQGKRKYLIYLVSWSSAFVWMFALISPSSQNTAYCHIMVIYGDNFPVLSRVWGTLAMVLLLSTILLYIATLHKVRKQYMMTFAWQEENGESAGKMEMVDTSKELQKKIEGNADNSSNAGSSKARNSLKAGSSKAGISSSAEPRKARISFNSGPSKAVDSSNKNISQNRKRKLMFESLKVVGIILLLLVLLTGPFVVLMFMTVFNFEPPFIAILILGGLSTLNSALNPFVYGWKIDLIRNEIILFFRMRHQE